jgi:hypothetical protein
VSHFVFFLLISWCGVGIALAPLFFSWEAAHSTGKKNQLALFHAADAGQPDARRRPG